MDQHYFAVTKGQKQEVDGSVLALPTWVDLEHVGLLIASRHLDGHHLSSHGPIHPQCTCIRAYNFAALIQRKNFSGSHLDEVVDINGGLVGLA